jgi:uncharacterized protein
MTQANLSHSAGIPLKYANRHGLIVGPTGTGKSVSLMRLAEQFSRQGVPVFMSDVKGDLGALSRSCPTTFLDCFGKTGNPLSVPFSAMGADIASRALDLSDAQAGCLEVAFHYATAAGRKLETIDHLRAVLAELKAGRANSLGTVSAASIGVIQRALLRIESEGGAAFFRAPGFDVARLLRCTQGEFETADGWTPIGQVSILQSQELIRRPRVYAAFLLWLLVELWERMPEVGDRAKPRLVLFFDEAHLVFNGLPWQLLQMIEQAVRLIRSKGVGIYFVSQSANDIPPMIRDQVAHRVTHDRALGVGVATLDTLDSTGRPSKPAKVRVALPICPLGPLDPAELPAVATVESGQWEKMGKAEFVLLLVGLALVPVIGALVYFLWGKSLLALATVVTAFVFKRPPIA